MLTPESTDTNMLYDRTLKSLHVSESRYRRLFETARDGILLLNADTAQIEDVNPYLIELLGYSYAEFMGKKLWEVGSFADRAETKEIFAELQSKGYVRYSDLPLKTKAGAQVPVEFICNSYDCEGIKVIQCNIRNISDRKAIEAKLQRHINLYAALSQCNKAIVHCVSKEELFLQTCRASVLFGGMKMAWIGLFDKESLQLRPVASFGDESEFLKDIIISVDADRPSGTAIRENQPFWCQDYLNDPATAPWLERIASAGFAASASLPLCCGGIVVGVFTLYSGKTHSFDESARDLLVEMATDISFALDNFAHESQRRWAQAEIEFKNRILKTQQETSLDAILVVDENQRIISYNQQFIELWQISPQLMNSGLDSPVLQSVVDQVEDPKAFSARVQHLIEHRDDKSREEVQLKDGRIIDRYSAPVIGVDLKYYGRVWYFRDITERKQAEAKIDELAFFDTLTHLANRTLMRDRLNQAMIASKRDKNFGALLYIDLDNFKGLNDTLGHDIGDLLLIEVAKRLTASVREGDTVARIGGDEFLVMLENLNQNQQESAELAKSIGTKILESFNNKYQLEGVDYHATASIGATLFFGEQASTDELMKQADLAMYKSKDSGRNSLRFFDTAMELSVMKRAAQEIELREAIEKKQFIIYYQAQIAGEKVTGAEALIRWQHPQRGIVSPNEFIPLAEEIGLILPLGLWVLETACAQLAIWASQPETAHLTVAVNVSAHQFRQPYFVYQVLAVLKHTGASPLRLKLELTESILATNIEDIIEKMYALKAKGVAFSLDDFGTGFSSLSYLKRMPLDQLKIDRSFIQDVLTNPNDAVIAKTIIALAESLGLNVIAEGVESASQRDFLVVSGCHVFQGYFYSRPLPLDKFEEFAQKTQNNYSLNQSFLD